MRFLTKMRLTVPFILASASPRRQKLLHQIGLAFDVDASAVDETASDGLTPSELAAFLALRKAANVALRHPQALTLGADTIVVYDARILNKPADAADARRMLRTLSGRTHVVHTGIALVHPPSNRRVTITESTEVTFAEMDDDEIASYVRTGSPMDKAGAYGIQDDRGALFVSRIVGDYYNVVGLPLHRFYRTIRSSFSDLIAPNEPI